jgi:hypothetical protein
MSKRTRHMNFLWVLAGGSKQTTRLGRDGAIRSIMNPLGLKGRGESRVQQALRANQLLF